MAYTTKAKVDALFGISIPQSTADDLIAAVKLFIDRYTGKTFEGGSETRYYDGNGGDRISVDSFYGTPTEVAILNPDGTTDRVLTIGQANDYITLPYNSTEKNQILLTGVVSYWRFPRGASRIKVTANFGYGASVPKDIELVATRLVGALYGGNSGASVKSETLGDYSVTYGNIESAAESIGVMQILDLHRDIDI